MISKIGSSRISSRWTTGKLNLIIGTRQQLAKHSIVHLPLGISIITPNISAKNLGVWIDPRLSLEAQINKICRSSFFYLHNIRRIRKFFSSEASATLVHAFITCRLDYCNSLILLPPCISNIKTCRESRMQPPELFVKYLVTQTSHHVL